MKRKWAERWADFLERPDVRKLNGKLALGGRLEAPKCCLGHLEFLVGNRLEQGRTSTTVYSTTGKVLKDGDNASADEFLSASTYRKVGMRSIDGCLFDGSVLFRGESRFSLADLNDAGMSLKKIAKVIRERYKDL